MKKLIMPIVLMLALFATSCNDNKSISEELGKSGINSIKKLERSETKAELNVSLTSIDGSKTEIEVLKPETNYIISVSGKNDSELFIRNHEGFKILSTEEDNGTVNYFIKTDRDIPEKLYLSISPVIRNGGKLKKQHVANFLLPSKDTAPGSK